MGWNIFGKAQIRREMGWNIFGKAQIRREMDRIMF
jgi:hypothetical protein